MKGATIILLSICGVVFMGIVAGFCLTIKTNRAYNRLFEKSMNGKMSTREHAELDKLEKRLEFIFGPLTIIQSVIAIIFSTLAIIINACT